MKTAVTGGTGFIGSHLVKRLVDEGREVTVVSDFLELGTENLLGLGVQPSHLELRKSDLTDYSQAVRVTEGVETVFHLAARVGSLEYLHGTQMAELATLQANLATDANVFRACLEKGVQRLIYASSVAVYPMDKQCSLGTVFAEDDLTSVNPDGGYGWAKLLGEIQLGWMKNIDIGIARIFNIYGENEPLEAKRAHVVGDIIRKVALNPQKELRVRGDGKQTRDFLYVSDCVDALLLLEKKASNPPMIVNIGSGIPVSIGTIAEKAVELSGKDIKIVYDLTQPVGPLSRTADITKARASLNWQPKVSLDYGLGCTYSWVQSQLAG